MADKVQNVLVNFKFNTAELEKATQLTNRANEASNKLQQNAQNAGKKLSDSFRQPIQSIESMRVQLARLKASLDLAVDPKKVQQLSAQYKELKKRLDDTTRSAYNLNKESKETNRLLGQIGETISTLFTAAVLKQMVDAALNLARLQGNAEGVERAFQRAFPNSVNVLNQLRDATHGTVTDFELMQRTLQATNLGVAVEQLPILFEFAAARAQQTGESVDYLVDSIVRGIGRKSILVLDNLGLSASRLRDQFNGASLASQSVAEVTAGVAAIAKVELDKMGGYVETATTKVSKLESSWENLRLTFAKKIDSGGIITFLDESVKGLEAALKGGEQLAKERAQQMAAVRADNIVQGKEFKDLAKDKEGQINLIKDEIKELERLITLRGTEIEQAKTRRQQIVDELGFFEDEEMATRDLNKRIKSQQQNKTVMEETILVLQKYIAEIQKSTDEQEEELGIIERKRAEIEKLQEAIEKTQKLTDLSSRRSVGNLVSQLAVAQAELKELLDGVPPEIKIKINLERKVTNASKDFEDLIGLGQEGGEVTLPPIKVKTPEIILMDFGDKLLQAIQENQRELSETGLQIFTDQLVSFEDAEVASLNNRLNNLRNFYDEQQILAGDNERAKQELRLKEERETAAIQKKIAQKEKEARRFSVIIDTAAGIVRAFATSPTIAQGIVNAAIVAAQGASQLAIINRTQPRFKDGVLNLKGPGTGTSDSIQARLSRGESVMTAKETKSSMGILKDIRAKRLDDRVLKDLKLSAGGVSYSGMDDTRIISELQRIREGQPNIIEQSGKLYKQYSKGKSYKVKSRISAMGY